ncbi:MAG: NAD-dependent epimerase/dehydratase family protein [Candidatus Micrarchaeia archaeon]
MKILVTGGAGFIGSNLVDALIRKKHEVIVLDNLSTGKIENINKKAVFYNIDLRDILKLKSLFEKERPEIVYHLAAQINVRRSIKDPFYDESVNIAGSLNLLECCKDYGINRIIYSSSGGAVYGEPNKLPAPEEHEIKPLSHYGASKFAVESYLSVYNSIYGLDYITLRYANVYGPRQDFLGEAGVIAIFIKNALIGEPLTIFGDGNQTRDFVFVNDVVNANVLSLNYRGNFRIFNIGTGIPTSINQIAKEIEKTIGKKITIIRGEAIKGEVRDTYLDIGRAKRELGFLPLVSISEGIRLTFEWAKNAVQ